MYCIRHLRHGQKYACKTLGKKKLLSQLDAEDIKKEIEVRGGDGEGAGEGVGGAECGVWGGVGWGGAGSWERVMAGGPTLPPLLLANPQYHVSH